MSKEDRELKENLKLSIEERKRIKSGQDVFNNPKYTQWTPTRGWDKKTGSGWVYDKKTDKWEKWLEGKRTGEFKDNPRALSKDAVTDFGESGWGITKPGQSLVGAAYEKLTKREPVTVESLDQQIEALQSSISRKSGTQKKSASKRLTSLKKKREKLIAEQPSKEQLTTQENIKKNEKLKTELGDNYFRGDAQYYNEDKQLVKGNKVVKENPTQNNEEFNPYNLPNLSHLFSQVVENPYVNDQLRYKALEGRNVWDNLSAFEGDVTYINAAKLSENMDLSDPMDSYKDALEGKNYYTPKTDGQADTTGGKDNTVVEQKEVSKPTWDPTTPWEGKKDSGLTIRDANEQTLNLIKEKGFDLRNMSKLDQKELARKWRATGGFEDYFKRFPEAKILPFRGRHGSKARIF